MPTVSPPYAPGFKETAAYFDERAKRTRNLERSLEFSETADFYNGLAAIVPSFPPFEHTVPAGTVCCEADTRERIAGGAGGAVFNMTVAKVTSNPPLPVLFL
jgi:hypothetical protein